MVVINRKLNSQTRASKKKINMKLICFWTKKKTKKEIKAVGNLHSPIYGNGELGFGQNTMNMSIFCFFVHFLFVFSLHYIICLKKFYVLGHHLTQHLIHYTNHKFSHSFSFTRQLIQLNTLHIWLFIIF